MIHIGNQTACWAATPAEPFDYAVANNFDAFEWFPDKKLGAGWDENDLSPTQRREIRETAGARGIRLSVHARWQANPLEPESYPIFLKDIELARDLGAALLNMHLFIGAGLAAYVEAIEKLIRFTTGSGLQLAIENTPEHSPEDFNELFARLRALNWVPMQQVGMCLDLGHANLCGATRNDYLGFLDRLDPQVPIIHLHAHENWGDADSHLPLFTGPAGRNDAGIRGWLARIQKRHFSGSIILEQWPNPPALLNQARDRILELLKPNVNEARIGGEPPVRIDAAANPSSPAHPHSPDVPGHSSVGQADTDFVNQLAAGDKRSRSWREKLEAVQNLLAHDHAHPSSDARYNAAPSGQDRSRPQSAPLTLEQLVDVAIYLRFLATDEIPCVEDGRHFRPAHHARIALQIQERLAQLTTPDTAYVIRKIYPWLPSSAQTFRRPEPLTRIRDIAHRNDIPSELKREIKGSLQNKLHRCAGPEDLATSATLLKRITAPEANYSPSFVEQFRVFHNELEEFFNARSLDQRLEALLPTADANQSTLIREFLEQKNRNAQPVAALGCLTGLRRSLLDAIQKRPESETQELLLADIGLEDFAFVQLSQIASRYESAESQAPWAQMLETLELAVRNLALSGIMAAECRAIQAELEAWRRNFDLANRDHLLRVKATLERTRRLAADYADRVMALFPREAEKLGRALGVPDHAVRVFSEAEIRGHLIFQVSKLSSLLLQRLRNSLSLPNWDLLVSGKVAGRLRSVRLLSDLGSDLSEPVVALLESAEGDEEIPQGVAGVLLSHEIPHLSHLGVRARQAGVVFVAFEEAADFENLKKLNGQMVSLRANPEKVECLPLSRVSENLKSHALSKSAIQPPQILGAQLTPRQAWISLDQVRPETGGGKADGARRLAELARQPAAGFKTTAGLVIPFGVMESALHAAPELEAEYRELLPQTYHTLSAEPGEIARVSQPHPVAPISERLRAIIQKLSLPREAVLAITKQFGPFDRLMVRSSANCEDLEQLAGAGLYESIANVAPAEVESAVRGVWSSLWTPRAALSRRQAGIPPEMARMAVLIQPMLFPDYSFVLHTVNPINYSAHEVYAELAVGLGETLVSAATRGTPYRVVYDKQSGSATIVAFANFSQALWCAPTGGVAQKIVNYSQVELSSNADACKSLARRLAEIARLVEHAFGKPLDIEGALVGEEIYLLQARPQQGLPERQSRSAP